jgi:hypothetical protein
MIKDKNNNISLIDLYKHDSYNRNSSQPFLEIKNNNFNNDKNRLSLGLETFFSSRIINPITEKSINRGSNQINNKNKLNLIKDNKNLLNKNTAKNDKEKNLINKSKKLKVNKYYETKKYNAKSNNINLDNFKNKKPSSKLLLSNKQSEIKSKTNKNNKKDLIKNKTSTKSNNFSNYNTHNGYNNKLKSNKNKKKGKVYENELYLYDNYQTLETNKDNYFLSTNQDLQEFSEGKINKSQFNGILDNSSMKEDHIIDTCSYNANKNSIELNLNKDGNKGNIYLKDYFQKWEKMFIIRKLINKLFVKKKMISGFSN